MENLLAFTVVGRLDCRCPAHYVARDFEAGIRRPKTGVEALMGNREEPDGLEKRRRDLEAALAARRPKEPSNAGGAKTGGVSGYGNALRLSSEFIAGTLVGAGLGWFIDEMAGTSPWGLIIFLLLGFGAGVLNVLRSAGLVAEFGAKLSKGGDDPQGK